MTRAANWLEINLYTNICFCALKNTVNLDWFVLMPGSASVLFLHQAWLLTLLFCVIISTTSDLNCSEINVYAFFPPLLVWVKQFYYLSLQPYLKLNFRTRNNLILHFYVLFVGTGVYQNIGTPWSFQSLQIQELQRPANVVVKSASSIASPFFRV